MPNVDFEQLAKDAQEYLDLDPRFWDCEEGSFVWWGEIVLFSKSGDWLVLEVQGCSVEVARF